MEDGRSVGLGPQGGEWHRSRHPRPASRRCLTARPGGSTPRQVLVLCLKTIATPKSRPLCSSHLLPPHAVGGRHLCRDAGLPWGPNPRPAILRPPSCLPSPHVSTTSLGRHLHQGGWGTVTPQLQLPSSLGALVSRPLPSLGPGRAGSAGGTHAPGRRSFSGSLAAFRFPPFLTCNLNLILFLLILT